MTEIAQHATVTTLTAEVRTLVVGQRQVTRSIYKQLDFVRWECVAPFGRVAEKDPNGGTWLVGRDTRTGALVRTRTPNPNGWFEATPSAEALEHFRNTQAMPLIVLAGLR